MFTIAGVTDPVLELGRYNMSVTIPAGILRDTTTNLMGTEFPVRVQYVIVLNINCCEDCHLLGDANECDCDECGDACGLCRCE